MLRCTVALVGQTIQQKKNADGFVKPGELVEIRAGTDLTLQDRRIFNLLIENAWSVIDADQPHRIHISALRGPNHRGSERVADSVKALMTTLVEVPTMLDGKAAVFTTQLLGETTRMIDEDSPNAVLVYAFPRGLRQIIKDSRYWGRLKAYVMFAFNSKHALALYEHVCLRANKWSSEEMFTVEDFRTLLGVTPGQYPGFPQLKQRVLTPALAEVNGLSDFNVEIEAVRAGGMVKGALQGFRLRWERKDGDAWKSALDELRRPRVGRAARLTGKVERTTV